MARVAQRGVCQRPSAGLGALSGLNAVSEGAGTVEEPLEVEDFALDQAPSSLDEVDHKAVSRVIRQVNLTRLRLQHSHCEIRDLELPASWQEDAYLLWRSSMFHRHDNLFLADVGFLVRYFGAVSSRDEPTLPTGDDAPEHLLTVECDYEVFYELDDDANITNRDLQHFCFFNAPVHAWPYMREFVHSMTARMGIDPYLAPLLPVPKLAGDESAETGKEDY